MLADLNRRYGTKFSLNIYYSTDLGDKNAFDLTQFSDRYKSQWQDNADWLKLAFHAYSDLPDRPYQNDEHGKKMLADMDKVVEQIYRFAGQQAYCEPAVIHWAMAPKSALEPLYGQGVRVLSGYFAKIDGKWDINYLFDDIRSEYIAQRGLLKDFDSGIVFSRVDIVVNDMAIEEIEPLLEKRAGDTNHTGIIDMFTHEQHFWSFTPDYLPNHPQMLEMAIRWVTERGYKPVFFHEGFLGSPK